MIILRDRELALIIYQSATMGASLGHFVAARTESGVMPLVLLQALGLVLLAAYGLTIWRARRTQERPVAMPWRPFGVNGDPTYPKPTAPPAPPRPR